jgi:hypothetical protein
LLIQFLTAFGNIVGRRAYFQVEGARHFPLLFTVLVGATSKARKGTSLCHVRNLLERVDTRWAADRIQGGLSSGEGLIQAVSDEHEDGEKRLLIVETEFSSLLRVMERNGNTISAMLRQAWDSGDIRTLTKNPLHATGTHISVIGHITREELTAELNSTEKANGFGNRILWACATRSKRLPDGGRLQEHEDLLAHYAGDIRDVLEWLDREGEPLQLTHDTAASQYWHQVYETLSEGAVGLLGAITSRAEAYVTRLAMIYALFDCSSVISREHLKAAMAVWEYCYYSAKFIFGDASGNPIADAILEALRLKPNGLTRTEISDLFSKNVDANKLNGALKLLADQGRAKRDRQAKPVGRPAERWIAVGA